MTGDAAGAGRPRAVGLREAAERLADAEEQLEPLVLALYEATDEPHI